MYRLIGLTTLLLGTAAYSLAGAFQTPEIDPAAGVAALVLLSGGLVVLRARRRKQ